MSRMKSRKYFFLPLATCCVLLFLQGCGFHLRGQEEQGIAARALPMTFVQGGNPQTGLMDELRRSGSHIVQDRQQAKLVLTLLADGFERRLLSVGSTGKAREFELYYNVSFEVHDQAGKELLPKTDISLVRDYRFDETQVLGKDAEEAVLRQDMVRDATQQILRRLQMLGAS